MKLTGSAAKNWDALLRTIPQGLTLAHAAAANMQQASHFQYGKARALYNSGREAEACVYQREGARASRNARILLGIEQ